MSRRRDTQRSLVYAWERRAHLHGIAKFETVEECAAFMAPIWRGERGRYGMAKAKAPRIEVGRGGGRAYGSRRITLGKWARQPSVILHEMAHALAPGDRHGPRFVGVYIGLLARHLGLDATALMESADAAGVKYHVRSVGAVPTVPLWRKLLPLLPVFYMDAATELDVSYRQINGAALHLMRRGLARWRGRTLVGRSA